MFEELLLGEDGYNLLAHAEFQIWSKFVNRFNEANTQKSASVFEILTENLGDKNLAKILVAAFEDSSTERLATNYLPGCSRIGIVETNRQSMFSRCCNLRTTKMPLLTCYSEDGSSMQTMTW